MTITQPLVLALVLLFVPQANRPPLLPEDVTAALADELSGEAAKRNLEFLAQQHRMRGSRGFRAAAEHIAAQLRAYGLSQVTIEEFPADGQTFYGTQRSRPAWYADFAELWELTERDGTWVRKTRLASWDAMPITLAEDSDSADVTTELVDVGAGTSESDYDGKEVRGKIVLAAAQPGPVAPLAVRYGAVGIVSYAQNQRTAWSREDENLVRWGHLDSFAPWRTFGFMVSLKTARAFQERLASGERIRLHARVHAARYPGTYDIVTAAIPGVDPALRDEEIVLTCHLDHQRPGANDNASGCVTILEVARTLAKLVHEGRIDPPARTLRFVWPPEIEGTITRLNEQTSFARRVKAVVHMDMVGGGAITKAVFHITRGPMSLSSFVYDVGQAFGAFVIAQSAAFAGGEDPPYPLFAPEGSKDALLGELAEFSLGSDHEVYMEGSWRIPAVYLNDWPDRYIHTNFDSPANIDPTKLKRAGFIGAASAYYLATLTSDRVAELWEVMEPMILRRAATMLERRGGLAGAESANLTRAFLWSEQQALESIARFAAVPNTVRERAAAFFRDLETLVGPVAPAAPPTGDGRLIFVRSDEPKGPMSVFGYDYFADHYQGHPVRLFGYQGLRGSGGAYGYEVLNLVDGRRSAQEIRDLVSAEYGPVPLELVVEYLRALQSIGVVVGR